MEARSLAGISYQLNANLSYKSEMQIVINAVHGALMYASDKKIDKDGERRVKEMVYRIETLFREIGGFMEESKPYVVRHLIREILEGKEREYSRFIGKVLRSSIASEMKLIMKELKPYSEDKKSLISRETMVGRQFHHQKEELIELLLDSNSSRRVIILGKPLTGRSTLIWDVFHDPRVQKHFNRLFTGPFQPNYAWSETNKSLIVVDDSSDVDKIKSLLSVDEQTHFDLDFFTANAKGSKIVIISSLQLDLELVEHIDASKIRVPSLEGDESWFLFQNIAFSHPETPHSTLVDIGRRICHKCENIPGVINIVASILSSKSTTQEWDHFLNVTLTSVSDPITTISSIIKLTKQLNEDKGYWGRSFAWCSLLPKDYEFQKDHLFHLWRAQEDFTYDYGCVERDVEKQLDPCFNEFLRRGYFITCDSIGSIARYKINHLIFELMKYVGGDDFCLVDKTTPEPNHKIIRHASFIVDPSWEPPSWLPKAKQLQSLLLWPRKSGDFISVSKIGTILSCMTHLRALHAEALLCETFPEFLIKFKNLKYLRFGAVSSISIPQDTPGLQKLINCDFRYNSTKNNALYAGDRLFDGILEQQEEELVLRVEFVGMEDQKCYNPNTSKQTNQKSGSLKFRLMSFNRDDEKLKSLNPPQTLERQNVCQWEGEKLPAWPIDTLSFFPSSLVSIQVLNFSGCQHLPAFNTLPHLSSLELGGMCSLVEITVSWENSETSSKKVFYPSLKCLVLCDLPELKGWSSTKAHDNQRYCFPLLTEFRVHRCPKLISMPSVPKLESMKAYNVDTGMLNDINSVQSLKLTNIPELTSFSRDPESFVTIKQVSLWWLANLKVLPDLKGQFTELRKFTIHHCPKLTMLPKSDGSFSALEQLEIRCCPRVSQFPKSLLNLKRLQVQEFGRLEEILCLSPNLEDLEINNCDQLEWETPSVEGDASVNVWESLNSLQSLKLTKMDTFPKGLDFAKLSKLSRLVIEKCPKLTSLPDSLCTLSTLEHLRIYYYPGLINLPDNLKNLGFLKKLEIRVTPQLEKRCKPAGEDWSLIQHIPDVVINDSPQQMVATWNALEEERDLVCAD